MKFGSRSSYVLMAAAVAVAIGGIFALWLIAPEPAPQVSNITVPDGFEIVLAAGPPLVERPITADFDEEGRLYVAESSGSNEKVQIQLEKRPHSILRLEDTDQDGIFDRRTVFADKMMFPEGTMWLDGSLYVSAPPVIWKLTDSNGDGIADRREEWFDGKTLTGCANDLHGPYLGPDGWIYWCKGAFAEQSYERPGKPPFVTRAAHIFRRHPEDSTVEPVMTGGMDNPVDVDFTPEGERILTATFYEHPQLGRRDALLHAIYGGIYGKAHGVLDPHKKTGEFMPNLTHYGPAAAHSVSVRRDRAALPYLVALLKDGSLHVRRAAAEALGRSGDERAVTDLLTAAAAPADRILEHSIIYALIEIGARQQTASGLHSTSSHAKRAALIALDQMDKGQLNAGSVIPLLSTQDKLLQETAWWIAERHPEWGGELAGFFSERLASRNLSPEEQNLLENRLTQFASNPRMQDLLARTMAEEAPRASRLAALRAMGRSGLKEMPPSWIAALERLLTSRDADLVREAVAIPRALRVPEEKAASLRRALLAASRDSSLPADVRLNALVAVPGGLSSVEPDTFELIHTNLSSSQPAAVRAVAAAVVEKAKLIPEQLQRLIEPIRHAGPMELPRLLVAFGAGSDEQLGGLLLNALKEAKGVTNMRADLLTSALANYPEPVRKQGQVFLASLDKDPAEQKKHLDSLLPKLKGGDVRRGQAVFKSEKAACSTCHAIGYLGGKLGPDLTRIGQIRTDRDLLEAVVYPDASFVRSYEPVVVVTRAGDMHNGILTKDAPDEVVLAIGAREEVRIERSEIAEMRPGTVSVMPSGLEQQLSEPELADLLAFLQALKRPR